MRARPVVLTLALAATLAMGARTNGQSQPAAKADVERHLNNWKAKPRELAQKLVQKYGAPDEVTANRLIWHNKGPWKVTELVNEEIPHEFPMPHTDMLYQAIDYRIDPSKADEILTYDGSVVLERTKGEIAARCDKEEPNFLAINLAHEVATGKRSVEDARKFYADSMMRFMKDGKPNEYHQGFLFSVSKGGTGDPDKPFSAGKSS
jgi:hypothetical protein